jgi:hypothetical protein
MSFSAEQKEALVRLPAVSSDGFKPIDRSSLSENGLFLLDRYGIENANDPIAVFVSMADEMSANQREVISRFESAIALAGVEFGRIDLAIAKAAENQMQAEALIVALDEMRKDFTLTTDKIRQRSNSDIIFNHLKPCIYGLFGAILTLLVLFVSWHLKIL